MSGTRVNEISEMKNKLNCLEPTFSVNENFSETSFCNGCCSIVQLGLLFR